MLPAIEPGPISVARGSPVMVCGSSVHEPYFVTPAVPEAVATPNMPGERGRVSAPSLHRPTPGADASLRTCRASGVASVPRVSTVRLPAQTRVSEHAGRAGSRQRPESPPSDSRRRRESPNMPGERGRVSAPSLHRPTPGADASLRTCRASGVASAPRVSTVRLPALTRPGSPPALHDARILGSPDGAGSYKTRCRCVPVGGGSVPRASGRGYAALGHASRWSPGRKGKVARGIGKKFSLVWPLGVVALAGLGEGGRNKQPAPVSQPFQ